MKKLTKEQKKQLHRQQIENVRESRGLIPIAKPLIRTVSVGKSVAPAASVKGKKQCCKCMKYKDKELDFYPSHNTYVRKRKCTESIVERWCKDCRKEYNVQYYQTHKEEHLALTRNWDERNREKRREINRRYKAKMKLLAQDT